ncbi:MAG: S8 family serine peptidase, partial [Bacteroidota bacterium]
YEAIIYAASEGFEVINLSWGSPNSFSQHRQDIINFATVEKGAVVVAAAGNTPEEIDFYPASYDNVLSVASTDSRDLKSDFSSYSIHVDLAAPGTDIISAVANNGYGSTSGTSFASPQVAGAAALLIALRPDWTNFQVMEQLRVTTDQISQLQEDQPFTDKMGSGRLNVLKALSETEAKSARIVDFSFSNAFGEFAYFGDTVSVDIDLRNYLNDIEELVITASSPEQYTVMLDSTVSIGSFDSLANQTGKVRLVLNEDTPNDERIVIGFDFEGQGYSDQQFIAFNSSTDRLDFGVGQSFLTTNSTMELGHEE